MGLITRQGRISAAIPASATVLGFLWGFAEATFFFIVPDVLLSRVALFSFRRLVLCIVATLAGSIFGGAAVYYAAGCVPELAGRMVHAVPFVTQGMFETVGGEFRQQGLGALFNGPASGKPYKIYALLAPEYAAMIPFILVSIPVRLSRFVAVGGLSWATGFLFRRYWPKCAGCLPAAHAVCWCVFYAFYWYRISTP